MTALATTGLTEGDVLMMVVVSTGLIVIACVAAGVHALWGPYVYEDPAHHNPARPGLFVVDELPPYSVIHETCPNPGCDERVCYCPVTDGLPCVGAVDPLHAHGMSRRPA